MKKADGDYLTLSTIHSAKGQEWRSVFVLSVVDGCIPSARAESEAEIEEERRLLYVAMTRAKDELVLVMPRLSPARQPMNGARNATATRSQFIPDCVLGRFARSTWSTPDGELAQGAEEPRATIDVSARVRELWRT